jgi:hypothetical protein
MIIVAIKDLIGGRVAIYTNKAWVAFVRNH